jgi:hypothetical protein
MPPITSPSQPLTEDGHIQFACCKVVKKLLTVDLTTCFVLLLSEPSSPDSLKFDSPLPSYTVDQTHREFVHSLEGLSTESDPLAQQAIIHVLPSIDGAMGRVANGGQTLRWFIVAEYLRRLHFQASIFQSQSGGNLTKLFRLWNTFRVS